MPENILVVEYEPRYTDRVRQALAGQPLTPQFAKDGEEAMKALESESPKLIVLSSVVPKISTAELIRIIRGRKPLAETPILLTVSGYNGKSPKQDAVRMGASDILPKPYSESEFLGKIQQMLGLRGDGGSKSWAPELDPEFTVRSVPESRSAGTQLTSNDIFGELLDDDKGAQPGAKKTMKSDDLDKMLADTLSGVRPAKKKDPTPTIPGGIPTPLPSSTPTPTVAIPKPPAPAAAKPKSGGSDLDRMLQDTLSGLEPRPSRPTPPPAAPAPPPAAPKPAPAPPVAAKPVAPPPPAAPKPAAAPVAAATVAAPRYQTEKHAAITPDKIPVAQPILKPVAVPPVEEDEPKDGTKFGQYVLLEKIATGGMAEVWKARMRGVEGFQKIVAIKKILPHLSDNQDFIEMFIDEAKLAAQLNHNNIIHIYDLGKIQSSYYIAMEYIDGHDLKTILKRGEERDQPMSVELACFIASKIAAALDYAHRKHDFEGKEMGLVHRDVSPQNVLISQEGDIKLCDFGIAKAASKASHTQAGALKGKLQYMSPEQAWGRAIDKRTDIFSLGTVLFEALTGRKLFTGDNELSILEQVREARVQQPSQINDEVTPEIDNIVRKALHKDAASRYQTAGEMAKDLDAVLYTFRPTPTSADLAIYMHRIWSPELVMPQMSEPEPEPIAPGELRPAPVPPPPPIAAAPLPRVESSAPSFGYSEPVAEKKAPIVPILIGLVAVIIIAVGIYMFTRKSGPAAATPAAAVTPRPGVPTTDSTASAAAIPGAATPATGTVAPGATTTGLSQSAVDEEVRKRLEKERERLLAQTKGQPGAVPAATATQPAARPAPIPTATVAEARPVVPAPAPVTPAPAPIPAPVAPAPAPVTPAPSAPEPAQVNVGDLVPAGGDNFSPARMTRRATVGYPPLAKAQHVEGTVILSALVNENGQVIDVRVIRGVRQAVGLNEAAEQIVRRSVFSAPTKNGVRVKAWTTVPVDFKL